MRRQERGSALLAALIVIAILAVVTVATLQLSSISKVQATRDARTMMSASCADTARQYLLGRLRLFGLDPTSIKLDQTIQIDNSSSRHLFTGHARQPGTPDNEGFIRPIGTDLAITTVRALPSQFVGGTGAKNRDISNMIVPGSTLGGRSYRAVVTCTDPKAGDVELEFTFKYGL